MRFAFLFIPSLLCGQMLTAIVGDTHHSGGVIPALISGGHGCGGSSDAGNTASTSALNLTGASIALACTGSYNGNSDVAVLTDNCGVASGGACTGASSNTWTPLTKYTQGGLDLIIWYAANPTVGSGFIFTNTRSSSGVIYPTVCGAGFSGVATISPFDAGPPTTDKGGGTVGSPIQPGSMTPNASDELLFSCALANSTATGTLTVDSSYSSPEKIDGNSGQNFGPLGWSYQVQSVAAPINPTWTVSPNNAMNAAQAAFKHQ